MLPSEELVELYEKQIQIVAEEVANLFTRFLKSSPVDTGAFRAAWDLEQKSPTSWVISNDMEYAEILFDGRRLVAGKWFGSDQWPDGGHVMLERFNKIIARKLDRIRI